MLPNETDNNGLRFLGSGRETLSLWCITVSAQHVIDQFHICFKMKPSDVHAGIQHTSVIQIHRFMILPVNAFDYQGTRQRCDSVGVLSWSEYHLEGQVETEVDRKSLSFQLDFYAQWFNYPPKPESSILTFLKWIAWFIMDWLFTICWDYYRIMSWDEGRRGNKSWWSQNKWNHYIMQPARVSNQRAGNGDWDSSRCQDWKREAWVTSSHL